ncbi:MAG: DNA-3-methyladenine glycosylase [Tepidisphaerales bacterium]
MPERKLERTFYQRGAEAVARELVGAILVHRTDGRDYRARIVETEAYVGTHDLACHASRGKTPRTEVMFRPGGCAYVYFIYGMYQMLNVVTSVEGDAQAVLIRAAEPLDGWEADLSGPGKLTRAMRITRADNGIDLTGEKLFLLAGPGRRPKIEVSRRVGVDYAKEWKDAMLRFFDADSAAVSRGVRITGQSRVAAIR